MNQQTSKEDQLMIETILLEADTWGLRWEVETDAVKYLEQNRDLDTVEAYIWAFEDWIK
jgi:hypothetical protein